MEIAPSLIEFYYNSFIQPVVSFLFVLTMVVFFHELGHFAAGRWFGVKINTFSVGFGRELWGRNDRYGTRWRLSLIPLGGYVMYAGDIDASSKPDIESLKNVSEEERSQLFFYKPVWQRMIIVAAGPVANFILAAVIFAGLSLSTEIKKPYSFVGGFTENSAAQEAGLKIGDQIVSVNSQQTKYFSDILTEVSKSDGKSLEIAVVRDGLILDFTLTPRSVYISEIGTERYLIGVIVDGNKFETLPPKGFIESVQVGFSQVGALLSETVYFLGGLFTGTHSTDSLGGPIQIAVVANDAAQNGFASLLLLTGFLSVNIGFINLLPIPVLDGGHLMYYLYELIRGKPLSEKSQSIGFRIGLTFVALLMLFAISNDIYRLVMNF